MHIHIYYILTYIHYFYVHTELAPTGAIVTSSTFATSKMLASILDSEPWRDSLHLLLLVFIIAYSLLEIIEMYHLKELWCESLFNWIDVTMIGLFYALVGLRIHLRSVLSSLHSMINLDSKAFGYHELLDFQTAADSFQAEKYITGMFTFLLACKILQYLRISERVSLFIIMMKRLSVEYLHFMVFLSVFLVGFAGLFYASFGANSFEMRTYIYTLIGGIRATVGGNFALPERDEFRIIGAVFSTIFLVVISMLMVNLLIAILNDAYSRLQDELGKVRWCFEQYQMMIETSKIYKCCDWKVLCCQKNSKLSFDQRKLVKVVPHKEDQKAPDAV